MHKQGRDENMQETTLLWNSGGKERQEGNHTSAAHIYAADVG